MSRRLVGVVALAVAGAVMGGCATPTQMVADHKLNEYCAKDGGTRVYRTVELLPQEYDSRRNGPKGLAEALGNCQGKTNLFGAHYAVACTSDVVFELNSTRILRDGYHYYDTQNNELIGSSIFYTRFGGDFPLSTAEPIGRACPFELYRQERNLFTVKGGAK